MLLTASQSLRVRSPKAFLWLSGILLLVASVLVGSVRLNTASAEAGSAQQPTLAQDGDTKQSKDDQDQAEQPGEFKIVRGRVINEQGEPVPGAQLWLPLTFDNSFVVKTISDDDGDFQLECPTAWITPKFWDGLQTVWAYAPGYSIQLTRVHETLYKDSNQSYILRLPPASSERFRILNPTGEPANNVVVYPNRFLLNDESYPFAEQLKPIAGVRSDKDGWVTITTLPADSVMGLELFSEEFGHQTIRVGRSVSSPTREIRLRPTAAITGQIVVANAEWAQGIRLVFETENPDMGRQTWGHAEAISDEEGKFEVPKIAFGGPLNLTAHFDPGLPVRPVLPSGIRLRAGEVKHLEIPFVAAPLVRGRIVNQDNEPVPDVEVMTRYGARQGDRATTDKDGLYEARSLPGKCSILLLALPEGYARPVHSTDVRPYQIAANVSEFEVPPIQLIGTNEIVGLLLDENNQPMANTRIDALDRNRRYGAGQSDSEGKFKITVPEGVESIVRLKVDKPEMRENLEVLQREPLVVRYIPNTREMERETARESKPDVILTGQILFEGKPIAGVPIIMQRSSPTYNSDGTINPSFTRPSPGDEVETDAEGNYRLTGLKAGDGYLIYIRPKFGAFDRTWKHYHGTVPEDADGDVTLPDVNLQPLSQSIAGTVVDLNGDPVEGATVLAQLRGGKNIMYDWTRPESSPGTTSDEQGRFQIKELPEEPLSIFAYINDPKATSIRFPVKFDIERNQQDIRIVLDPSLIEE